MVSLISLSFEITIYDLYGNTGSRWRYKLKSVVGYDQVHLQPFIRLKYRGLQKRDQGIQSEIERTGIEIHVRFDVHSLGDY